MSIIEISEGQKEAHTYSPDPEELCGRPEDEEKNVSNTVQVVHSCPLEGVGRWVVEEGTAQTGWGCSSVGATLWRSTFPACTEVLGSIPSIPKKIKHKIK